MNPARTPARGAAPRPSAPPREGESLPESLAPASSRLGHLAPALVLALTALPFIPGITAGFVGDDFMILDRVRRVTHAADLVAFFRAEFFGYYRPLGFLSHAVDWHVWGLQPAAFHATNLLLHVMATALVLMLAARLAGAAAGIVAALLFGLHAANHEAVFWAAARFDLLAAAFGLATVVCASRPGRLRLMAGTVCFALALLSKESVVALPLAVLAHDVFVRRLPGRAAAARVLPLLTVLGAYALLRAQAAGLPVTGGSSRWPKLALLVASLLVLFILSTVDRGRLRRRASSAPRPLAALGVVVLVAAAVAASGQTAAAAFVRQKLAFVGFAGFYLLSPVVDPPPPPYYLDPATPVYWVGGLAVAAAALGLLLRGWHTLIGERRLLFAAVLLFSAVLPVSSLTEGARYVYLPSAALALVVALVLDRLAESRRRTGYAVVAAVVGISMWQVVEKARDWQWAGRMTREAAAAVARDLGPDCALTPVVFLTTPVGVRGVYTHFYYETFEVLTGCTPDRFQTVVRVVRRDSMIEAYRDGVSAIVLRAPSYEGNFVLSSDFREFRVPVRRVREAVLDTPLGGLRTFPEHDAQVVRLALDAGAVAARPRFYYFSAGRVRPLDTTPLPSGPDGRASVQ